jgi:hypothetical protein
LLRGNSVPAFPLSASPVPLADKPLVATAVALGGPLRLPWGGPVSALSEIDAVELCARGNLNGGHHARIGSKPSSRPRPSAGPLPMSGRGENEMSNPRAWRAKKRTTKPNARMKRNGLFLDAHPDCQHCATSPAEEAHHELPRGNSDRYEWQFMKVHGRD